MQTDEEQNSISPEVFELKKSLVGYVDLLGFSNIFSKKTQLCMELLASFTSLNGEYFENTKQKDGYQIRPATSCFSDCIVISIPTTEEINNDLYMSLLSYLHAISHFSYQALLHGFYMRGALSLGDMYHKNAIVAGEALIECVAYEKKAIYPRIILTPSLKNELIKFSKNSSYGLSLASIYNDICIEEDPADRTLHFNWLKFIKKYPESNQSDIIQKEILRNEKNCEAILKQKIREETDFSILQKLNWMKDFINRSIESAISEK